MNLITPITSAFIGYLTNKMAIMMLFHPKKNYFGIQGLLIKRKAEIAKSLSHVIVDRLLSHGASGLMSDKEVKKLCDSVASEIISDLEASHGYEFGAAKSMLIGFINDYLSNIIKTPVPQTSDALSDMKGTIVANIIAISDTEIETIITEISKKEFRAIEITGAIVGFLIGVLNVWLA